MESQLQHTHGRHYDEHDNLTAAHHTGHDHNEDEHHGEKKSVIKKVKEKAKKLKNTITKHGHGHDHHHRDDEDDDDDDDETVEDPEVHGAPMYDSARVAPGGPDAILAQPGGNLERPSVMAEDRYPKPVASHDAAPLVSTGAYGTKFSSGGLGHTEAYDHQVNPEKWRGKIGQPTGMEEDPFAPNSTRVASPISVTDPAYGTRQPDPVGYRGLAQDVNKGGLRTIIGRSTGMDPDPHAPTHPAGLGSDPSNYETKVTNPTHTGGKETDLSQLEHSFDKMGIGSGPKTFHPNQPENLPRDTLFGNPESRSSGYVDKISSSASAIADKAATAKDVIASKLGYSGQHPTTESHETVKDSGSATDYVHKITDKVSGTLAPVYEKVVDTGSSMISKVQGTVTGAGSATGQPQMHGGTETAGAEKDKGTDVGVSVKEYLAGTMTPGDDDKALKEVITHAFQRGTREESEKKSSEDRPMGRVTESVEVRQRLGTDRPEGGHQQHSGIVTADKGVTERLSEAMGSWFGGKGDAAQGTLGTSYVSDEGLSSNPTGCDQRRVGGKDERD